MEESLAINQRVTLNYLVLIVVKQTLISKDSRRKKVLWFNSLLAKALPSKTIV